MSGLETALAAASSRSWTQRARAGRVLASFTAAQFVGSPAAGHGGQDVDALPGEAESGLCVGLSVGRVGGRSRRGRLCQRVCRRRRGARRQDRGSWFDKYRRLASESRHRAADRSTGRHDTVSDWARCAGALRVHSPAGTGSIDSAFATSDAPTSTKASLSSNGQPRQGRSATSRWSATQPGRARPVGVPSSIHRFSSRCRVSRRSDRCP